MDNGHAVAWYGLAWLAWYGIAWHGIAWHGMAWHILALTWSGKKWCERPLPAAGSAP